MPMSLDAPLEPSNRITGANSNKLIICPCFVGTATTTIEPTIIDEQTTAADEKSVDEPTPSIDDEIDNDDNIDNAENVKEADSNADDATNQDVTSDESNAVAAPPVPPPQPTTATTKPTKKVTCASLFNECVRLKHNSFLVVCIYKEWRIDRWRSEICKGSTIGR
jgi:hypothetical protein